MAALTLEARAHPGLSYTTLQDSTLDDLPTRDATVDRVRREASRAGLRFQELGETLTMRERAGFISLHGERLSVSIAGRGLTRDRTFSWRDYCLQLLNLPWAQDAAAKSLHCFNRDAGLMTFDRFRLSKVAPQLSALLTWMADDKDNPEIVSSDVAERLLVSTHLESEAISHAPAWVRRRGDIGLRAEHYSLFFERSCKPPAQVLHVAAESDRYGYDIEDRTEEPPVLIEVKGSSGRELSFFITAHERRTAAAHRFHYRVHFWGSIDLGRPMRTEYLELRAAGFPLEVVGLADSLDSGELLAEPTEWHVTQLAQDEPDPIGKAESEL